jgi:hypothetical protein
MAYDIEKKCGRKLVVVFIRIAADDPSVFGRINVLVFVGPVGQGWYTGNLYLVCEGQRHVRSRAHSRLPFSRIPRQRGSKDGHESWTVLVRE